MKQSLSEAQLEEGSMICPHCGELLEFNYDNIEADESAAEEAEAESEDPADDETEQA